MSEEFEGVLVDLGGLGEDVQFQVIHALEEEGEDDLVDP